jgi:hypothetical protein
MNAAFVSDECDGEQDKQDDQNNALFVFREFEDSEGALHLQLVFIMLSEAKHLWFSFGHVFR